MRWNGHRATDTSRGSYARRRTRFQPTTVGIEFASQAVIVPKLLRSAPRDFFFMDTLSPLFFSRTFAPTTCFSF